MIDILISAAKAAEFLGILTMLAKMRTLAKGRRFTSGVACVIAHLT